MTHTYLAKSTSGHAGRVTVERLWVLLNLCRQDVGTFVGMAKNRSEKICAFSVTYEEHSILAYAPFPIARLGGR
jgi:hypothetical protein